jgi:soluble lytic murein transglycosylase-like protein
MRRFLPIFLYATALGAQPAGAGKTPPGTPGTPAAAAPETAKASAPEAAKPSAAARSYQLIQEESIAKQRAAIQKQVGGPASTGFFVLPAPATLGATVFADAPAGADCDPLPAPEIDRLVGSAAKRESLDENVLRGVISQESAFRPCAVSPKGAMGLMQLMPGTAQQLDVKNPFDPEQNVNAGARYLKELLTKYGGDMTLALGAYNAGPAKVDAAGGVPPITETQEYIRRILSVLPFGK